MPSGVLIVTSDFGHGDGVDDLRQRHGHAGAEQDAELAPRHQPARLVLQSIVLKMVLIAHIRSSSNTSEAAPQTDEHVAPPR